MTDVALQQHVGVAVCTYNPDLRSLRRTLAAVESLEIPADTLFECVIIDNNSTPPVATFSVVAEFLRRCPWARVIEEARQGLTFARIAAIEATTAPILCFVDDDNEPAPDYLAAATRILSSYPCIGALGPGHVIVEYLDPVPDWFASRFTHHFQQRDRPGLVYGCVPATWTDYYPPGSCLVVRRTVLERYRTECLCGHLSATDRCGRRLSSGGDTQIVWEAVKMGYSAGISSDLALTHLIPGKRANLGYIRRLSYGTSASYLPALVNSFPAEKERYAGVVPDNLRILRDAARIVLRHVVRLRLSLLPIELAGFFGRLVGMLRATEATGRQWVYVCVKLLRLN